MKTYRIFNQEKGKRVVNDMVTHAPKAALLKRKYKVIAWKY